MPLDTPPLTPPTAPPPLVTHNDFDQAGSYAEIFPRMDGRSRLYLNTRGKQVKPWRGQVLEGAELALAVHAAPSDDHHAPQVTGAAASDGERVVTITASELPRFLQAHCERGLIVANAGRVFWILVHACEQAGIDPEFLWRKIAWRHFTDVTLLDTLLRLPRPFGELVVPRTLYDIAAELAVVHTLPATPRDQLMKIMHWRTARAKFDPAGFLAGEAHGMYLLCARLLRPLPMLSQPPLFASAQQHLIPEHWFEVLQRLLLRASIARQKIYTNGLACDAVACMDHKAGLVLAAGEMMKSLSEQRPTWHLFGDDAIEGQLATSVRLDGDTLLKVLRGVRRKYQDLPDLPDLPSADYLHPVLLSVYSQFEPALQAVALFQMDLRLNADMLIGENGRLRLRYVNLPHVCQVPAAFDYVLQYGYSRMLRTSAHHALLLICCSPGYEMDPDLLAALVLSAGLEVIHRGYRVVAHFEGSLILEASGEQLTEDSQLVLEKIITDHIGLHLQKLELVTVVRRMCGWEGVENVLLSSEARERLGKPA